MFQSLSHYEPLAMANSESATVDHLESPAIDEVDLVWARTIAAR